MSWTTTGTKMKDNIPNEFETHNWNQENLNVAVKWCREYAKEGWVVTMYHNSIKPRNEDPGN